MHIVYGVAAGAALGIILAAIIYRVSENFDKQLIPI